MTDSADLSPVALVGMLASEDWRHAVRAARSLGALRDVGSAPALVELMVSTADPRVRDAAAIALADMRAPDAKHHIVALLRDEKTVGSRGSLLYALQEGFDFSDEAPMLAVLSAQDNMEVRASATQMLLAVASDLEASTLDDVTATLQRAKQGASDEVAEELGVLLHELNALSANSDD